GFWLPQIIQGSFRGTGFQIGVLSAIPYLAGAIAMVLAGRHSDRRQERRWHVALAAFTSCAGFVATAFVSSLPAALTSLTIPMIRLGAIFGPIWTLSSAFVQGTGAAAGIALINSVGNIGGFVGPYLVGYVRDRTQSFAIGLIALGVFVAIGGLIVLTLPEHPPAGEGP